MPRTRSATTGEDSQNRSLERGLEILKAFRPGLDLMGNSEIAERTGLPRSTISRLTHTLMNTGMLDYVPEARAYRLGAANLSLGLGVRLGNPILRIAKPLMKAASEKHHVNVGLATADLDDMVYLESVRYNRRAALRTVVSGQRIPIKLTSLGRAYLATLPLQDREQLITNLLSGASKESALEEPIRQAIKSVEQLGYCAASWQPGVVAVATPLAPPDARIYALNMSLTTSEAFDGVVKRHATPLLQLRKDIEAAIIRSQEETTV